ncbi:isoflavone 2'-hydroxylase-like protein, partial [Tanacetum coccineum]
LLVHKKLKNLPRGPPSLPIIGHLHLIKSPVHRIFQTFSFEYGPVISLRFGSHPVLVVTSPSAVEECFTNNDVILANRPALPSGKYLDYNQTTLSAAPYGHLWRDLRRITTLELFSSTKLKAYMRV